MLKLNGFPVAVDAAFYLWFWCMPLENCWHTAIADGRSELSGYFEFGSYLRDNAIERARGWNR